MQTTLMIGTTKGAFLANSDDRDGWAVTGPHCEGWAINHVVGDPETGRIWAGGGGDFFGAGVFATEDGGNAWTRTRLSRGQMDDWAAEDPDVAQMFDLDGSALPFDDGFSQIWSLAYAHGRVYAGTKPARLLASDDGGASFAEVESLRNHPSSDSWNPGAAGLVLHTILPHPDNRQKMWLGISAAGVFATEDGGTSWERRNRVSNAEACSGHDHPAAPRDGETGHCVHNIVRADDAGDLLYQQNHHGVWRSTDGGRSWDDITEGLPSTFGFPIQVHPHDPKTIWTLPLNGDSAGRFPPGRAAAVWKSSDGGDSWQAKRAGLPQENCFFTVLRQAMTVDAFTPTGVYFGTNSGSVFASTDEGETWNEILRHLPTILSVEAMTRA